MGQRRPAEESACAAALSRKDRSSSARRITIGAIQRQMLNAHVLHTSLKRERHQSSADLQCLRERQIRSGLHEAPMSTNIYRNHYFIV